jgi:hypothetical protein
MAKGRQSEVADIEPQHPAAADRTQRHDAYGGFFPSVPTQVNFELAYAPVAAAGAYSRLGLVT